MSTGFTELKRAWLWGWRTPRVLGGWLLLVGALGSLRWLGRFPGWQPLTVVLSLFTLVWAGRQWWCLLQAWCPELSVTWRPSRHWMAWTGLVIGGGILALPWGLWGLSSRFWVRLPMNAQVVNWVTLNRRPFLVVVALVYLGILGWGLLWGPRHLRITPRNRRGTPLQMLAAVGVQIGLLAVWLLMTGGIVWANYWLDQRATLLTIRWVTAGSLLLILLGFTVASLLGNTILAWSWVGQPQLAAPIKKDNHHRWWTLGFWLVWLVVSGAVVTQTLTSPRLGTTTLISHRGVDHHRGVQNTLGALRAVHAEHPQYVEMDLHETQDHQWVVLHDESLQALAGRDIRPVQRPLRALVGLPLHEHGQTGRLVSWQRYLKVAEDLHQPLLVELKTTPQDSPGMAARFARQYGKRLRRDGSAVHSLDYRVVATLRQRCPQLRTGYITPFNWVDPRSVPADFYSFQRLSVSDQFILAAHQQHATAYLWTPDHPVAMTSLWALGADGQITNELAELRRVVQQRPQQAYWAILWNFTLSYI